MKSLDAKFSQIGAETKLQKWNALLFLLLGFILKLLMPLELHGRQEQIALSIEKESGNKGIQSPKLRLPYATILFLISSCLHTVFRKPILCNWHFLIKTYLLKSHHSFYFLIRSNNKKAKQSPLIRQWGKKINEE